MSVAMKLKRCSKCGEEKPLDEFYRVKTNKDGRAGACKLCRNEIGRQYYEENKDWLKIRMAEYRQEHKEEILKQKKEHYCNNKEAIFERAREYARRYPERVAEYKRKSRKRIYLRQRNDVKHRITVRMSGGMRKKVKGLKGGKSWQDLVPYTTEQLIARLKKTMPDGYTWDDFLAGSLEIDHIVPVSVFNYKSPEDPDFHKCWALKNLQLLPSFENKSKNASLDRPFQPSFAFGGSL